LIFFVRAVDVIEAVVDVAEDTGLVFAGLVSWDLLVLVSKTVAPVFGELPCHHVWAIACGHLNSLPILVHFGPVDILGAKWISLGLCSLLRAWPIKLAPHLPQF